MGSRLTPRSCIGRALDGSLSCPPRNAIILETLSEIVVWFGNFQAPGKPFLHPSERPTGWERFSDSDMAAEKGCPARMKAPLRVCPMDNDEEHTNLCGQVEVVNLYAAKQSLAQGESEFIAT